MKSRVSWLFTSTLVLGSLTGALFGQTVAPDNSKQNRNANQTRTADNQPNAKADRQTAAGVRRAIVKDKSLSTYAHNVKVLVAGGEVTLKGVVHSDDEKQKVEADAATAVAADKIVNKLTIK